MPFGGNLTPAGVRVEGHDQRKSFDRLLLRNGALQGTTNSERLNSYRTSTPGVGVGHPGKAASFIVKDSNRT